MRLRSELFSVALCLVATSTFSGCLNIADLAVPPAHQGADADWGPPYAGYLGGPGSEFPATERGMSDVQNLTMPPLGFGEHSDDGSVRSSWKSFAWQIAAPVPLGIDSEYVVPERFLDEDQRPWRAEMNRRFAPLVKDCKTREEAILLIAKNAARLCGVEYSTARRAANQCVAESLESHKASCTGLSILLAAAYRSVGIPARLAGTGEWGDRPGNHTWVEVWDGDWHAIEYYPDKKGWDRGWFYEPVVNYDPENPRSRVMAVSPSGTDSFFLPWDPENKSVHAVDRTADYLRVAARNGVYRKTARPGMTLVPVVASDDVGHRFATDFRILDGGREIFAARTPGPLDDLNNAPRAELSLKKEYVVEYADRSGAKLTKTFVPEPGNALNL